MLHAVKCLVPSLPLRVVSGASLSGQVLPHFRRRCCQVSGKNQSQKSHQKKKQNMNVGADLLLPFMFFQLHFESFKCLILKRFHLEDIQLHLEKLAVFFENLDSLSEKNTHHNHRSSQLHRVASCFTWFSWDLILFGFGFLVLVLFGSRMGFDQRVGFVVKNVGLKPYCFTCIILFSLSGFWNI